MKKLKETFKDHFASLLNSYAMVFFSKTRVFAWLLLIVSFFDPVAGISGLVSVMVANLAAHIIGFNHYNIRSGFYGFNSLLVGLGIGIYFQLTVELFILIMFASLLTLFISIMLEGVIGKYGLPFLTVPFLLSFWMVTLAARYYTELHISERGIYQINELYSLGGPRMLALYNWFNELPLAPSLVTYFKSLSAILFQYHLLTGILVATGLIYYSRIAFLLSIVGYYSAFLFYAVIGANFNELNYSFIGFNYILTSIAIGGFFIIPSRISFLWVILLTPLISILVTATSVILGIFQLSTFSLPFNFMVLLFIYALKLREKHKKGLKLVGLQEFSPENNLYSQQNNEARFPEGSYIPIYLPVIGEWTVTQAHSGEITHRDNWRHAWDFEITDEKGSTYIQKGLAVSDYYCYNKPVVAPANGWVEEILDHIDDNEIGQVNLVQNWGNTIIIRHSDTLYTKICHLRKGSFKVTKGKTVRKGEIVALCGNSGRSPVPHVHFHVQATPFIGSNTLNYPIAQYLLHDSRGFQLQSFSFPSAKEKVSAITHNDCLGAAFHLVPGQSLDFLLNSDGKNEGTIHWEVMTDIYNNTYLNCAQSNSRAYFRSDTELFYFTWFEGDKNSLLFSFYLAAYKIALGYYPGLVIRDTYPLKVMRNGFIKVTQDFLSPFYIFIHTRYEMQYHSMGDELEQTQIKLLSSARRRFGRKETLSTQFEFEIDNNRINKFIVKQHNHTRIAIWAETSHA